jgi:hypothetical protein
MKSLKLTPGQAVTVHGWWEARLTLTWNDIRLNDSYTLDHLLAANISLLQLYALQPDVKAWIRAGKFSKTDFMRVYKIWNAQLIEDFGADLSDVIHLQYTVDELLEVGITYNVLLRLGLTPEIMQLFGITLLSWIRLGFAREHAHGMDDATTQRVFGMLRDDVLRSFAPVTALYARA